MCHLSLSKLDRFVNEIGHFQVPKTLSFKIRQSAQPLFYLHENGKSFPCQRLSTEHLVWNRGLGQGNSEMAYSFIWRNRFRSHEKKYIFFYLDTLNWLVWRGKRHSLFQYKTLSVGNNDESGYLRTREATSNWSGSDALFLLLLRAQASSFLITVTWLTLEFEGSTPSWKSGR